MPINRTANMVNLAKAELLALDPQAIDVKVNAATFRLLMNWIVEVGEPPKAPDFRDTAARTVLGRMTEIEQAVAARAAEQALAVG